MGAAGDGHTVALSEVGHVFTWGYGGDEQLDVASSVRCLAGEVGLLRMIAGWCRMWRWVGGTAGREEGVLRLLGGV